MMKKLSIVLALILAVFVLTACGGSSGNNGNNGGGAATNNQASESNGTTSGQAQSAVPGLPTFEPFVFSGAGDVVTDSIEIPARYAVASIKVSNNGENHYFGVQQLNGSLEELMILVNTSGDYQGSVLIDSQRYGTDGKVAFSIDADGNGSWDITVTPLVAAEGTSFAGTGDYVSGVFLSPGTGMWKFSHDGMRNFQVYYYSLSGNNDRVVNEIGAYDAESNINLGDGYVFLVIIADGNWSITQK